MLTLNFQLMQHHKWGIEELENMLPWEREIYIKQLKAWIEEENLRLRQQATNFKR